MRRASQASTAPPNSPSTASRWQCGDALAKYDIGVSCLCPANIRTDIAESIRTRPASFSHSGFHVDDEEIAALREIYSQGLEPEVLAGHVLEAVKKKASSTSSLIPRRAKSWNWGSAPCSMPCHPRTPIRKGRRSATRRCSSTARPVKPWIKGNMTQGQSASMAGDIWRSAVGLQTASQFNLRGLCFSRI
jgi:hypothetical protein